MSKELDGEACRRLAIKALSRMACDDDLSRARAVFRRLTPEQMNQKWGQSDDTPAEILKGYESRQAEVEAALRWLEGVKGGGA